MAQQGLDFQLTAALQPRKCFRGKQALTLSCKNA